MEMVIILSQACSDARAVYFRCSDVGDWLLDTRNVGRKIGRLLCTESGKRNEHKWQKHQLCITLLERETKIESENTRSP